MYAPRGRDEDGGGAPDRLLMPLESTNGQNIKPKTKPKLKPKMKRSGAGPSSDALGNEAAPARKNQDVASPAPSFALARVRGLAGAVSARVEGAAAPA